MLLDCARNSAFCARVTTTARRLACRSIPCRWACRPTLNLRSPKVQRRSGWARRFLGNGEEEP